MPEKRRLLGLLAGINAYPPPVRPLHGCINDIGSIKQYLESESAHFDLDITMLQNEEVTKSTLIQELKSLFNRSKEGDVVLFYFSGHGTREEADPVFYQQEADRALESLVCFDSLEFRNGTFHYHLLSDKEIHFVLSSCGKNKCHNLLIFDCCHSGGITRNMMTGLAGVREKRFVPVERGSYDAPMRRWEDFAFSEVVSRDQIEMDGWLDVLPDKRHLNLSACQNDESAYESDGSGVFTRNLLSLLSKTKGNITYRDLRSRLRNFIRNQYSQTPEMYAPKGFDEEIYRNFLDLPGKSEPGMTVEMYYQPEYGWVIDLGTLQGLSDLEGMVKFQLNGENITTGFERIHTSFSEVALTHDQATRLDKSKAYPIHIENYLSHGLAIWIISSSEMDNEKAKLQDAIMKNGKSISIAGQREGAAYLLVLQDKYCHITENNLCQRPVVESIDLSSLQGIPRVMSYLKHISQWEYVRDYHNPDSPADLLKDLFIEFYLEKSALELNGIELQQDKVLVNPGTTEELKNAGQLKIKVSNKTSRKLYCSLVFLGVDFSIYGQVFPEKVLGLNPGEEIWANGGEGFDLVIEPRIRDFNLPSSMSYFKLIAGTDPFHIDSLEQDPLPSPRRTMKGSRDAGEERGILTREEKALKKNQWFTRLFPLIIKNPDHDPQKCF